MHFRRRALGDRRGVFDVRREVGPIAEMASAAHHRKIHAGPPALHLDRQDVDVLVDGTQAAGVDRLLVQHPGQRFDLLAQLGRLLVLEPLGMGHHALLQVVEHGLGVAAQEALGIGHVARVVVGRDQADAGPRAAPDLVQQAGPRAIREHRVLAGAQPEYLLDQVDRVLHRPGARVGAEVAVLLVDGATVIGHARKGGRHQLEVRIALVVAKQDVEARAERLDQVVLEQQCLGFAAHHRGLEPRDAFDHQADARACMVLLEVARHALPEVARLADVEHGAGRVEVAIDTRPLRQRGHFREQVRAAVGRRRFVHATQLSVSIIARCAGTSSAASSTTTATWACAGAWPPTSPHATRPCGCGSTIRRHWPGWRRTVRPASASCTGSSRCPPSNLARW